MSDPSDGAHQECRALLEGHRGLLVVPVLVVTEIAQILARRLGARSEAAFLLDVASGRYLIDEPNPADWIRIAALVDRYASLGLGAADASVVAAAERLGVTTIATLDHRHFSVVQPAHTDRFTLLP